MDILLLKCISYIKNYELTLLVIVISLLCGIVALYWQLWLIFGIIIYITFVIYFSKGFKNPLNIHVVALSSLILHATPSTILILLGEIPIDKDQYLTFFATISIGLMGYILGALFFKRLVSSEKGGGFQLSKNLNFLFWLSYKYRFVLAIICTLILFNYGFLPMGLSYQESVKYRMETPGVIKYYNSLINQVFSVLTIAMISIIGDIHKRGKLSLLSYLLIGLVVCSIIGGHRGWILSIFCCLMLTFQSFLKRRHILLIIILAPIVILILSGGVRYARSGGSFTRNIQNFSEYLSNILDVDFINLLRASSDFEGPFSTYITLIENVPHNMKYDYTLPIKDMALLIPTIIYPERPLPVSQWYVKTFKPDIYERGGGLTFYVIGFGYLFAGIIGSFICLFLYGVLFEIFRKFFIIVGGPAAIFLYSCYFISLFAFARGTGIIVYVKTIIMYIVIPISLLFIFILALNTIFKYYFKHKKV